MQVAPNSIPHGRRYGYYPLRPVLQFRIVGGWDLCHLNPRFGVCVSARLVRPCVSGRKHEGRGFPSSTPSKAFPLLQTRPAASAFLSRDSKWRKLEERLHGSLTANRSTARRPKILYAIEADLLVAYAGVRPVVRRVTWLRIAPNSLSGKSSTSIIHNKSRPSPTDH